MLSRLVTNFSVGLLMLAGVCEAHPVFGPGAFTSPTILDYRTSPVGLLAPSTAILNQYAALGVLHNGQTTTPPGPAGMSSFSGLPALEAPPPNQIRMDFTVPVREVGAFYIMASSSASITLTVFGAGDVMLDTVTVLPGDMPLRPGPFGFNEGFVGLILDDFVSYVTYQASISAFAIDDFHFSPVPEPSSAALAISGLMLCFVARWSLFRHRKLRANRKDAQG